MLNVQFGCDRLVDRHIMLTSPGGYFEAEECITLFLEEVAV